MKINWIKTNLSPIQKICLAGLFTALAVIMQKVVAVNYIPVLPFVRVSFCGPALIIFASILLGPIYGALVALQTKNPPFGPVDKTHARVIFILRVSGKHGV